VLHVDAEVRLAQLTLEAAKAVRSLAPFGMEFPEPLFLARNVVLKTRRATSGDRHQKVRLTQRGSSIGGVFFNAPSAFVDIPLETPLDVLLHLELNEWNGAFSVEARLRDWRIAG
jgi:single-stranded-DNA-specific exonuclease